MTVSRTGERPVTIPVAEIVATDGRTLPQTPAVVPEVFVNAIPPPLHTLSSPTIVPAVIGAVTDTANVATAVPQLNVDTE